MKYKSELAAWFRAFDIGRNADEHQVTSRSDVASPGTEIAQRLFGRRDAAHGRTARGYTAFDIPVDELAPAQQRACAVDHDRRSMVGVR